MNLLAKPLGLSWDESAFYVNGAPLRKIENVISLPSGPQDPLDWEKEAGKARASTGPLLWELDLGLFKEGFSFDDEWHETRKLALRHFMETLYSEFKQRTIGVILYKGSLDIAKTNGMGREEALDQMTYHLTLFAHMLYDEIPIFLLFDIENLGMSDSIRLLDKKRFEHAILGLRGGKVPLSAFIWEEGRGSYGLIGNGPFAKKEEKVGVLMPDGNIDETLRLLEKVPYRLLYEDFANTSWDGLDAIIVFEKMFSVKAKRVLQGFQAAGGKAIVVGETLGLSEEIPFKEWIRGRGI